MLNNLQHIHLTLLQKSNSKNELVKGTGDLIGNKTADKITKVSTTSPQNSSGTVTYETENIGMIFYFQQ